MRWFHTLPRTKSPKLDLDIANALDQWSENMPLRIQTAIQVLTNGICSLTTANVVDPDGIPVELLEITLNDDPAL